MKLVKVHESPKRKKPRSEDEAQLRLHEEGSGRLGKDSKDREALMGDLNTYRSLVPTSMV